MAKYKRPYVHPEDEPESIPPIVILAAFVMFVLGSKWLLDWLFPR